MKFGEKLRQRRLEKGLTQGQLAAQAGLGKRTIIYYENGEKYPRDREVYKRLAEILDIDADYLHNENDDVIAAAKETYGSRGKRQAEELLGEVTGLFAGGDMAPDDMDEFMRAVQEAYWLAKDANKKYTRKDYARNAQSDEAPKS